jgi:Protein of unknown function (DUF1612)/HTH DNA binding domain
LGLREAVVASSAETRFSISGATTARQGCGRETDAQATQRLGRGRKARGLARGRRRRLAAIAPLQHDPWLSRLLVAALLRKRGKTRAHLACHHDGFRSLPYERRRGRDPLARLIAQLEAITAAAEIGLKAHNRWFLARAVLAKKLDGRRSSSRLPGLLDYVLSRPIVSAGMIVRELGVTPRGATGR